MNLIKAVTTVGGWTAVSRVMGLFREMLMSYYLGASEGCDAFVIAFKFPNFFRRFFAEGAFNAAFVPLFAAKTTSHGKEAARILASNVFSIMTIFLILFVIIFEFFTPTFVKLIAPGFTNNPDKLQWAVILTRITFPYIFFISLTALLGGLMTTFEKFWITAAAPVILNITMITSLLFFNNKPFYNLSISVAIAGILQFAWLYWACVRNKFFPTFQMPRLTEDVKTILKKIGPGMIGAGVMQINMFIDINLASLLPTGSLSYLYYADRIYQLPMSVFGVAVGTALLPTISKLWKTSQNDDALALQNKALKFVLFMNIPAAFGLITLNLPIISLLFGHGKFSAYDVLQTAPTLAAYALGLPAYVASKVFATTFFSTGDTKTPVKVAVFIILINLGLNLILMSYMFHTGLALATSIAAYAQTFILGYILYKKKLLSFNKNIYVFILITLIISCLMGICIHWLINNISFIYMSYQSYFPKFINKNIIIVLTCTTFGILFYMTSSHFCGTLREIKKQS